VSGWLKKRVLGGIDVEIYTDKLEEDAREVFRQAYNDARHLQLPQLGNRNLLKGLSRVDPSLFDKLCSTLGLESSAVLRQLELISTQRFEPKQVKGSGVKISEECRNALAKALSHARGQKRSSINSVDLLHGILSSNDSSAAALFSGLGVDFEALSAGANKLETTTHR
jgi:ATP-dependent Clp protease ATP-binding subunit ClpA